MKNTKKPFEPSTRVVEGIHTGFVEVLNGAAVALMSEAMEAAREEIKEELAARDRALAGVIAALNQERSKAITVPEYQTIAKVGEAVRVAMDLWHPRSGRLYDICERCNFSNHICMGCGEELGHLGAEIHNAGPGPKCHE